MEEITNHNCEGLCCEEFCDEKQTHCTRKTINGLKVVLGFCKKHSEQYEDNL